MGSSHRRDAGTFFYYSAINCRIRGSSCIQIVRRGFLPVATSITLLVRASKRIICPKKGITA